MQFAVYPDPDSLSVAAATRVSAAIVAAVEARGEAAVALAGGSTPRRLYERLALPPHHDRIPWSVVDFFWGDERAVPADDPESNYRMARETLLDHIPVRPERIHRMPADRDADLEEAARAHAGVLRATLPAGNGGWPRFDLVLLGMGEDGHTASLFPGDPALDEMDSRVAAVETPYRGTRRLTLTLPVLNAAAVVLFLVVGGDKAEATRRVLADREPLPAGRVQPESGQLFWMLDAGAARLLGKAGEAANPADSA